MVSKPSIRFKVPRQNLRDEKADRGIQTPRLKRSGKSGTGGLGTCPNFLRKKWCDGLLEAQNERRGKITIENKVKHNTMTLEKLI